jgi:hypothetical protein
MSALSERIATPPAEQLPALDGAHRASPARSVARGSSPPAGDFSPDSPALRRPG